ncbi:type I restriction endonuclease subunit R [Liberiplasma polymorphum]|uniref:type I restriction endonuclease subunit R n=1 Tax=Liberiplasma polymorphum TaxID=3374570 RepID=UPI003770CA42
MNRIITEKQYQRYIIDYLKQNNDYIERRDTNFDRYYSIDKELLFNFLNDSQPDEIAKLKKTYKDRYEETLINFINNKITSSKSSLIETLKNGIELSNVKLRLMYTKPATIFNKDLNKKYEMNIFSVAEEIYSKENERIDLVIFLNGFAIISFELKCNASGQNYEDAVTQYRTNRDYKSRLFLFKAGCIVNFAMDLEECHMTTKLTGYSTYFLPFNKGNGEGIEAGKGNPLNSEGFGVSYIWEDILKKDNLIEIISKFVFIERIEKEDPSGKKSLKETIIFPRYHQLDCIRKTLNDVIENKTNRNYLIQHSAGSGKTYTIAWLAHRLSSFHDKDSKIIYDNIIIITDRVIVDRQLQKAVSSIEHKVGLIKVLDDNCTSKDLKDALEGNTKIIATTIQKFLYVADIVKGLKDKSFAVIIDEAHSSTAGKDMAAVTRALGSDINYEDDSFNMDAEDIITDEICKHGKQDNVSMFAFTATPKPTTLAIFGHINPTGYYESFHLYSMKQAIEEGFILNVLQNFTPYQTFYKINKAIENDPKLKSKAAKKKIARFAMLHETNIVQRIEIIIEHFRNGVLRDQPWAKGMVVTGSRAEAIKYYDAFIKYVDEKGYKDVHPLVAFSGKISEKQLGVSDDNEKYFTESSINGFSEIHTSDKFDKEDYQVLLVANKYQTGFDQPKLSVMYVLKKLNGISAVQTLSRLNRIYPPYQKKTFILDFVNSIDDIQKAFEPYYASTILCNTVTPELVYEIDAKIDSFNLFTLDSAIDANELFYSENYTKKQKEEKITFLLSKSKKQFDLLEENDQRELYFTLRKFIRFYEFLLQVSSFSDIDLHKKYNFIVWLLPYLKIGKSGNGFDLKGMIDASNFYQKKGEEFKVKPLDKDPYVNLPTADIFNLTEDEEQRLSDIINEVNSRTGKSFDNDVALKAALQIKDLLKKNPNIIASARVNPINDFEFSFYSGIDDALVDGLQQNQDFFTMLLNNNDLKKEVLGIFLKGIYDDLKSPSNE